MSIATGIVKNKKGQSEFRTGEVIWREHERMWKAFFIDEKTGKETMAVWAAQPGSQQAFLECRNHVYECLYEGNRGPGKTDALLMDFAQETGKGFGALWRGFIMRRTYPELEDVINKSLQWFPQMWPEAQYNGGKHFWRWPSGETLYLRQFENEADYWKYHGHEYPWQAWEELTNWPDLTGYFKMQSLCRCSGNPDVPCRIRATCNPYGVGHGVIKEYFRLPVPANKHFGTVIDNDEDDEGNVRPTRVAVHGHLLENKVLLHVDPTYPQKLRAAASNDAEYQAWVHGNWNIVAGGMFSDVWDPQYNVVPSFTVPHSWIIDRAFDWGSSKPFSVGWWAESDGSDLLLGNGKVMSTVRGDLFRIAEWYGWNGKANKGSEMLATQISEGIVEREIKMGLRGKVYPGPADTSIFTNENGPGIAADMAKPVRVGGRMYQGVQWTRADKKSGSRITGWQKMREMLKGAHRTNKPRENPGLFAVEHCAQFIRTIPALTRDPKKMDDVDTKAEDHIADETRYRVRFAGRRGVIGRAIGSF